MAPDAGDFDLNDFDMNDADERTIAGGRCYTYVFPCAWEDHCKIGFSRDPLARIASLHPRWYEVFDLDRIVLIEVDAIREARDLELRLRRPLVAHRAPPPSTMRIEAGGVTEWLRGASASLDSALDLLKAEGHRIHAGRPWLTHAFAAHADSLVEWALAQHVHHMQTDAPHAVAPAYVRDELDALRAFDIDPATRFPPAFMAWYTGHAA